MDHIGICLFISHSLMFFFSLYIALYTRLGGQIQLGIKNEYRKGTRVVLTECILFYLMRYAYETGTYHSRH